MYYISRQAHLEMFMFANLKISVFVQTRATANSWDYTVFFTQFRTRSYEGKMPLNTQQRPIYIAQWESIRPWLGYRVWAAMKVVDNHVQPV